MIRRIFLYLFGKDKQNENLINNINEYDNARRKKENKVDCI